MDKSPALESITDIGHGFFGRVSPQGDPFNMSLNFDETGTAARNRQIAVEATGATGHLVSVKQVHSDIVVTVTEPKQTDELIEADSLVTALPGIALGILTADCAPILFADPKTKIIGACHAGWRGAVGGIIQNTVDAMAALGAEPKHIIAAIGPTISTQNYEVGPEFVADLEKSAPEAVAFTSTPPGKSRPHFDLPGYAQAQLASAGIKTIEQAGGCTYAHADRYFSHRHTTHHGTKAGRQIAIITRR